MRVLVAYRRYRQPIQGEQIAIDALADLLKEKDHQVAVQIEELVDTAANLLAKENAAISGVYNSEISRRLANRIDQFKRDLVHFHKLYPRLGLSGLAAFESRAVPSLLWLHNYFLTCPIYKHYRDDRTCANCTPRNTLPCLTNNCRGELRESLVYAGRCKISAAMRIRRRFDEYIAQSRFAKGVIIKRRVTATQVNLFRNLEGELVEPNQRQSGIPPCALFLGRIATEKEGRTEDIIVLTKRMPSLLIKVAGGTLSSQSWEWPDNVKFLGQLSPGGAQTLLTSVTCLLFAGSWFVICSLALLEPMHLKTPLIAKNIGSVPKPITHGKRGPLYVPGNISPLEANVRQILDNREFRHCLVENAYRYVLAAHFPDTYYQGLIQIYRHIVGQKNGHG